MKKEKFTKGPWMPVTDVYGMAQQVIAKDGAISVRLICDCHAGGKEERNANARLISASPEMLEALQSASFILDEICCKLGNILSPNGINTLEYRGKIDMAIQKALGE
jgi:hypothetical protein